MIRDVFAGFPPETQAFLADLAVHNEKAWFDANRSRYDDHWLAPAKAFVVAAGERLRTIAPAIRAEPRVNGSIMRVNRDVRFSTDKRPYKETLDFWFYEGSRRAAISGLFVRIAVDQVVVGAGAHGFDGPRLQRYREALLDPAGREALVGAVAAVEDAGYVVEEQSFKKLPRAVARLAGTSAERLGRHGALFAHADEDGRLALDGPALLDRCERHWRALVPLHEWLTRCVG